MKPKAWIITDYKLVNTKVGKDSSHVNVDVYLSPSNMPVATRGFEDPDTKKLIIEFKYVDELSGTDEVVSVSADGIIQVVADSSTHRIRRVEIDFLAKRATQVTLNLQTQTENRASILKRVQEQLGQNGSSLSAVAAERVLRTNQSQLSAQLSAALG